MVIRCDPEDHQINCVYLRGLCPPSSQFKVLVGISEGSVLCLPVEGSLAMGGDDGGGRGPGRVLHKVQLTREQYGFELLRSIYK